MNLARVFLHHPATLAANYKLRAHSVWAGEHVDCVRKSPLNNALLTDRDRSLAVT